MRASSSEEKRRLATARTFCSTCSTRLAPTRALVTRGQSVAQLALAWILRDARVTSALVGASRVEQVEQNVRALANLRFSSEELARIEAILERDPSPSR